MAYYDYSAAYGRRNEPAGGSRGGSGVIHGGGGTNEDAEYGIRVLIREREADRYCADCGAADPDQLCYTLGTIVCNECATVHRNMKRKIKGLYSGSLILDDVKRFESVGNERCNKKFLYNWNPNDFPQPTGKDKEKLKEFIWLKYEGSWSKSKEDKEKEKREKDGFRPAGMHAAPGPGADFDPYGRDPYDPYGPPPPRGAPGDPYGMDPYAHDPYYAGGPPPGPYPGATARSATSQAPGRSGSGKTPAPSQMQLSARSAPPPTAPYYPPPTLALPPPHDPYYDQQYPAPPAPSVNRRDSKKKSSKKDKDKDRSSGSRSKKKKSQDSGSDSSGSESDDDRRKKRSGSSNRKRGDENGERKKSSGKKKAASSSEEDSDSNSDSEAGKSRRHRSKHSKKPGGSSSDSDSSDHDKKGRGKKSSKSRSDSKKKPSGPARAPSVFESIQEADRRAGVATGMVPGMGGGPAVGTLIPGIPAPSMAGPMVGQVVQTPYGPGYVTAQGVVPMGQPDLLTGFQNMNMF